MTRKSKKMEWLRHKLYRLYVGEKDPKLKMEFRNLWDLAKDTQAEYDEIMLDILMQGVRNPAFPDDLIGWLDDDFESPLERYENRWKKKSDDDQDNKDDDKKQKD